MTGKISIEDGKLEWSFDYERLIVEPWGENALRVRATQLPEFEEADWALLPPSASRPAFESGTDRASIANGKIRAEVELDGTLTFFDAKGGVLLKEYARQWHSKHRPCAVRVGAREFTPIPGGDFGIVQRFEAREGERLYGMGQYQQPFLDLKGCRLELAHRNSQSSVPFALSSLGYGFLWHSPAYGEAGFGKNLTEWTSRSARQIDYWITAGDKPAEIMRAYARATGFPPEMPEFATGFWQSKLRYQTQDELLAVAREHKRRGLPLSVIVIDFFHWLHHGDWDFDPAYWPDPAAMAAELKALGVELAVSVWPTVDKAGPNFQEMLREGLLVNVNRGARVTMEFMGDTVFFDATNPRAREYLWSKAKKSYYDRGVRVFWLDEAEPEYGAYDFDNYRYRAGTALRVGNLYPQKYAQAFWDGMKAAGAAAPLSLVRCAWAGSQRYGALVWSGDVHSDFLALRNQISIGMSMGLAGIPWWTSDIGGFFGGDANDPAFVELLLRWFQFGAFCPVFRLHGDRSPATPPLAATGGGCFHSGAANEVWSYGEDAYAIMRKYLFMRERLRPYVSGLMRAAHERGEPPMRPLFYDFPDDPSAWEVEDQYMFGPDLLVAPVYEAGARERKAYLPAGAEWTEADSGVSHAGGTWATVDAPLDSIPLFVRNGRELPVREDGAGDARERRR